MQINNRIVGPWLDPRWWLAQIEPIVKMLEPFSVVSLFQETCWLLYCSAYHRGCQESHCFMEMWRIHNASNFRKCVSLAIATSHRQSERHATVLTGDARPFIHPPSSWKARSLYPSSRLSETSRLSSRVVTTILALPSCPCHRRKQRLRHNQRHSHPAMLLSSPTVTVNVTWLCLTETQSRSLVLRTAHSPQGSSQPSRLPSLPSRHFHLVLQPAIVTNTATLILSYLFRIFFVSFSYLFRIFFVSFSYLFRIFFVSFSYLFRIFFVSFSYLFRLESC